MNEYTTKEVKNTTCITLQELPLNWKWMLVLGVLMLVFGTLGLLASNFLTLLSVLTFGGFIFAGGVLQFIQGAQAKEKEWGGKIQHFVIALLYIIVGLIIFWDPLLSSLILTVILVSMFAAMGVARITYAFYCRKQGWKWLLPAFSGLLNFVLTAMILATLPESAFWLIGMLVAIEMLLNGWFIVLLSLRVRKAENNEFST